MYLHLGQDVVVRQKDIVGVFDMENTTISRYTRHYLTKAEKGGRVEYVSMELPKSFIVCDPAKKQGKRENDRVYVSQISPATLQKRAKNINGTANKKGGADNAE